MKHGKTLGADVLPAMCWLPVLLHPAFVSWLAPFDDSKHLPTCLPAYVCLSVCLFLL